MAEVYDTADGGLLDFISDIYGCAVEPYRWPTILENTSKLVRGCAAAITTYSPADNALRVETRWNTSTKSEREMIANAPISPAVPAIWLLGTDQTFAANEFFGDDEFRSSLWCERVLKPMNCCDVAIAPLTKSAQEFSALMITRRSNLGPYGPEEVEMIQALSPHFQRAAAIAGLLNFKPLAEYCLGDTPTPRSTGIILTDATGKIVHTNSAAERMLDGCVLLCVEGGLSARDGKSAAHLQAAIAQAGKVRTASILRKATSLVAKGPGVRGIAIWVLSLDSGRRLPLPASSAARVAVFAQEFGEHPPCAAEMFAQRHGISAAESRLLVLLAQGMSLEKAARALGIPTRIARARLSLLLEKTHARNEADLVSLMTGARSPVPA